MRFKKQTRGAKTVIRTGEATPYANIILHAGTIVTAPNYKNNPRGKEKESFMW
jgi:hypothetical protein